MLNRKSDIRIFSKHSSGTNESRTRHIQSLSTMAECFVRFEPLHMLSQVCKLCICDARSRISLSLYVHFLIFCHERMFFRLRNLFPCARSDAWMVRYQSNLSPLTGNKYFNTYIRRGLRQQRWLWVLYLECTTSKRSVESPVLPRFEPSSLNL